MTPLLTSSGIHFAYAQNPVLRDVSVSLRAGEIVALLGPNGSGKTTLIRVLLGHLRPSVGSILWDDRTVQDWPRRELARRVAYLPQSPTIEPEQRVIDVLRLGRAPYLQGFGIESSHDLDVVQRVIHQLDLPDIADRPIASLSGGQRQRVFVGRCLVQEPAALLLDEPSTFLDLKAQIELATLLKALAKNQKIGVLMASHDLNLAAGLADRILLLKSGALAAEGPPDLVLQPELLEKVYEVAMERVVTGQGFVVMPRINPAEAKS
jgi:iron complex transport system ATP-binding protein